MDLPVAPSSRNALRARPRINGLSAAAELVFLAAIAWARCVSVGARILLGAPGLSGLGRHRRAALREARGNPLVQSREHLLVSLDHGVDDFPPKCVEFLVIHLEL
jgi:hypothetical protein